MYDTNSKTTPVRISFLSWSGTPFIPYGMHNKIPQFLFKFTSAGETLRTVEYLTFIWELLNTASHFACTI